MKFDWTNFTYDSEWLREAVRIEDECGGEVGAGYGGLHLGELMANPSGFTSMKRLQSIVARELRDLLTELNLGIGTEAAFICGRKIVMERLAEPAIEVQEQLWAVLAEDEATNETDAPKPLRAEVKHILFQMMTPEDWETIAQAVTQSMHRHLIQQSQTLKVAQAETTPDVVAV
jgi:flagellar biosynthesis regulator FlaF